MKTIIGFCFSFCLLQINGQEKYTIYLFPGQGSDYRIFNGFEFPENCDTVHISFPVPDKGETMKSYALRFIPIIDTSKEFILIGVSLGGMICSELTEMTNPAKTIIISSAKCRQELPGKYKFQKYIPLNKIVSKSAVRRGAIFLQPRVEPDSKTNDIFIKMLSAKDKTYLKRSVNLIVNWERETYSKDIIHVHGTSDNTIPIENVSPNYIIEDGSHMMAFTRAKEINKIINEVIKNP